MTELVTPRIGFWTALRWGWRGFAPVVLGNAAVQGLLVVGDPVPGGSWSFALRALVSVLAILVVVWLVVCWAQVSVDGSARSGWSLARRRTAVLAWTAGLAVLAVAAILVHPLLATAALLVAALVLPHAGAGAPNPLAAALNSVRATPLHAVGSVLALAVVVVLGAVVALLLGFFVTGVLAAVVTWLWFGAGIVVVACVFTALSVSRR